MSRTYWAHRVNLMKLNIPGELKTQASNHFFVSLTLLWCIRPRMYVIFIWYHFTPIKKAMIIGASKSGQYNDKIKEIISNTDQEYYISSSPSPNPFMSYFPPICCFSHKYIMTCNILFNFK